MTRRKNQVRPYQEFILSPEWRDKHSIFLKASGYQCPVTWQRIGKGHKYNCHHLHYDRLYGSERFFFDVIPLSKFAHDKIAHGILSGFKRPSSQKVYPNTPQRIFNYYCRIMLFVQAFIRLLSSILASVLNAIVGKRKKPKPRLRTR